MHPIRQRLAPMFADWAAERGLSPVPIRPAASVVLVAPHATKQSVGSGSEWRTLLVQRHAKARFMQSAFVFPGGCVEDGVDITTSPSPSSPSSSSDAENAREGLLQPPHHVDTGTRGTAIDHFRRCALRELQEETGISLAGVDTAADRARRLVPIAHWTTPAVYRYRYNTWFFAAAVPDPLPAVQLCPRELVDAAWMTPRDAITRHMAGAPGFALPLTTLMILEAVASLWPRASDAEAVLAGSRHPLRRPPDLTGDNNDLARLPGHAVPQCRVDAAGCKHWYVHGASAAPHLRGGGTHAYMVANETETYGCPATMPPETADAAPVCPSFHRTRAFVHVL